MPTLFVSHGSPLLAIDTIKGIDYARWGMALPRPKAILVFSAHWEGNQLVLGEASTHNDLIYDFSGFPEQLYHLKYPAPGSAWLIEQVQAILGDKATPRVTTRGLDHGVWIPFLHLWPEADIPIVQMSMPYNLSNQELYEFGQQLALLREQGVLIVGSGMITHNLAELNPHYRGEPQAWAKIFDDWTKDILLQRDIHSLLNWEKLAPNAQRNHPTVEHFRPLLIAAGAADMQNIRFPIEGFDAGILSCRSVQFG